VAGTQLGLHNGHRSVVVTHGTPANTGGHKQSLKEDDMAIAQAQSTRTALGITGSTALLRTKLFIAVELMLLIAVLCMAVIVKGHPGPLPGDVDISLWWQHLVRPHHLLTTIIEEFRTIGFPVPAAITMIVLVTAFAAARRWLDLGVIAGVVALADGSNWRINIFVHRPRPAGHGIVVDQHIVGYYSFPSGHVEHALALLGIVLFLSFQTWRLPWWPAALLWVVRIALLAMIVMQPPAAVLEGEHWPSDVLAGLLYGSFWLGLGAAAYYRAASRWPRFLGVHERRPVQTAGQQPTAPVPVVTLKAAS
jgi:membrane-associated phospholipid phosphatase